MNRNIQTERTNGVELSLMAVPVPEPGTYALMLGGLGVMAWMARRRKKA